MNPTRRLGRQAAAVAIIGLSLLASCSSDKEDDDAASSADETTTSEAPSTTTGGETTEEPNGDGCDIVSDEVVSDVLGIDIARREPNEDDFGNISCIKGNERTDDPTQFTFVSVGLISGGASLVDQGSAEPDSVAVEGLGDEAVFVPSAGVLYIATGDDGIQVQVVEGGIPGTQQDAMTIAEDVLGRV